VDTAYISAFSALAGAIIGGLASFGSSWLTQRTQLLFARREAIKARREALYVEFVDEAARLYGDALGHQKDDAADLVKLFCSPRTDKAQITATSHHGCRAYIRHDR